MRNIAGYAMVLIFISAVILLSNCGEDEDESFNEPIITGCKSFKYKGKSVEVHTIQDVIQVGYIQLSFNYKTSQFPGVCFHIEALMMVA